MRALAALILILIFPCAAPAQNPLAEDALRHLGEAAPAPTPPKSEEPAAVSPADGLPAAVLQSLKTAETAPGAEPPPGADTTFAVALLITLVVVAAAGTAVRFAWLIPMRVFGLDEPPWMKRARPFLAVWRWPYAALVLWMKWWRRQTRRSTDANAGWETPLGVLARYGGCKPGEGIPFGAFVFAGFMWFEVLGYKGDLGINVIGKPGSGKSALFVTWLGGFLAQDASAFFIDVDGEIVRVIGDEIKRRGHPLYVIDLLRKPDASYDVFAEYAAIEREQGRAAVIPAMKATGEAIVVQENQLQKTFDNGGRDFLVAVIGFTYRWDRIPREKKNLVTVRELICNGLPTNPANPKETPLDVLLFEMEHITRSDDGCGGMLNSMIARGASAIRSGQNRDGGNPFLGSARRATTAWDLPAVVAATSRSDFLMSDLKTGNACVAVVCSVGDMRTTYQPLARLLVQMLEYRFVTMPRCRKTPAAIIVDEAQNLGEISICTTGPYLRKYEAQIILGIQDLPGLEAVYGKRYETIISNAGMNCVLPTTDERTLQYVSRTLGTHTVREKVEGTPFLLRFILPRSMQIPNRYQNVERPLKNFEQLRDTLTPGRGRMVVTGEGRPFVAGVLKYWKVLPVSAYAPSTYAETWARSFTRKWMKKRPQKP